MKYYITECISANLSKDVLEKQCFSFRVLGMTWAMHGFQASFTSGLARKDLGETADM